MTALPVSIAQKMRAGGRPAQGREDYGASICLSTKKPRGHGTGTERGAVDNFRQPESTRAPSGHMRRGESSRVSEQLWKRCVDALGSEVSEQDLNTWIRPLQAEESPGLLRLFAPNRFVMEWVQERFMDAIRAALGRV